MDLEREKEEILVLLEEAGRSLGVRFIAHRLGLCPNLTRTALTQLEHDGLAAREAPIRHQGVSWCSCGRTER
jgi:DNA-binding IclR family transcriptional regulator